MESKIKLLTILVVVAIVIATSTAWMLLRQRTIFEEKAIADIKAYAAEMAYITKMDKIPEENILINKIELRPPTESEENYLRESLIGKKPPELIWFADVTLFPPNIFLFENIKPADYALLENLKLENLNFVVAVSVENIKPASYVGTVWLDAYTGEIVSATFEDSLGTLGGGAGTVLSITPSSFYGGCSTHVLTATLTDANGKPLAGKVIVWSATPSIPGYAPADVETLISPIENVTNSLGQASIAYWAPVVDSETTVTIAAEFAGDELYVSSRGVSIGTIVPGSPPPPPVKAPKAPTGWPLIAGIVVAIVVICVAAIVYIRRR
jgi:hypothetical protein